MRISKLNDKQIEKCRNCIYVLGLGIIFWEDPETLDFVVESEKCKECENGEENGKDNKMY